MPCNYPNKGTVPGEAYSFVPSASAPVLYAWQPHSPYGTNPYPGAPSSITNGSFTLTMQTDGNLVLYEGSKVCWSSGTNNNTANALWFQSSDGNLVIKRDNSTNVYWASNVTSNCGDPNAMYAYYTLQSDGNFVMRFPETISGSLDVRNTPINSYNLADTNTAGGTVNNNHRIR